MVLVARWRAVALDVDILDHGIVITVLHVRAAPADLTTSPINGTLPVVRVAGRPQRKLHSSRGLGVMVLA